jgi:hypothetical protein
LVADNRVVEKIDGGCVPKIARHGYSPDRETVRISTPGGRPCGALCRDCRCGHPVGLHGVRTHPDRVSPDPTPVTFVALGDMPYRDRDAAPFEALLDAIGERAPDVTIHVGEIKGGGTPCSDARLLRQHDHMNGVAGPLVYTPGDNEWTDCHRPSAGGYDARERLAALRAMFFPGPRSIGRAPIALERQSDLDPAYPEMVENARWRIAGVRFATAHVVGSNNGRDPGDPAALAEHARRDPASAAWIASAFDLARREGAQAQVLAIHADPYLLYGIGGGFRRILAAISEGAEAYGGPVLVVHGDGHEFTVDTPFFGPGGTILDNAFPIEVPGAADIRAVRVRIDPRAPTVFAIEAFGPGDAGG